MNLLLEMEGSAAPQALGWVEPQALGWVPTLDRSQLEVRVRRAQREEVGYRAVLEALALRGQEDRRARLWVKALKRQGQGQRAHLLREVRSPRSPDASDEVGAVHA